MKRVTPLLLGVLLATTSCAAAPVTPLVPASPTASALAATRIWHPQPGVSWQIQYAGKLAPTTATVVDLDGVETTKAQVAALHRSGKKVICYFSAGSYENWRPDRGRFPKKVVGRQLKGWPGERWLDIRNVKALLPIMTKRIDQCKAKGFDAVDPDNMDGYSNAPTGFPLKPKHTVAYLKALSKVAHARGLAIGLKGSVEVIAKATGLVEFAVNESCLQYHECGRYAPLVKAHKPVFHIEYAGSISSICARTPAGFSTVRKHLNLDAWALTCN